MLIMYPESEEKIDQDVLQFYILVNIGKLVIVTKSKRGAMARYQMWFVKCKKGFLRAVLHHYIPPFSDIPEAYSKKVMY